LNSLIPFPIDPAISGIRLAPNRSRMTTMMINSSGNPDCRTCKLLEKRTGYQISHQYPEQTQSDTSSDGPRANLSIIKSTGSVSMRSDSGRKEFFRRTRGRNRLPTRVSSPPMTNPEASARAKREPRRYDRAAVVAL
jgi:hypothetical protein